MQQKKEYGQLTRFTNDDYIKPDVTETALINNDVDKVEEKLEDYIEAPIEDIQVGSLVRYFVVKNGAKTYRQGGRLINKNGLPAYVVLSNGKNSWSVQVASAVFYRRMSIKEIELEYKSTIDELEDENESLKEDNKKLKNTIFKLMADLELCKKKGK